MFPLPQSRRSHGSGWTVRRRQNDGFPVGGKVLGCEPGENHCGRAWTFLKLTQRRCFPLFSIVFQDVTLFDNTILENIRIGNKDATDEQVLEAARLANVDEFAEKLPDGWHTTIGGNMAASFPAGSGSGFSIARAFLKNAPIILLDEATASLDVENETLIQSALSRLIADKTVLVIAHRMRTVAGADKIVVLSEGTVAEEGAPEKLMKQNGLYARMVKLQTESQNWKLA